MGSYIVKRVLRSFVTLFLVCTIVFCLLRLMPVEGIGGMVYRRLGLGDINAKNSYIPQMVLERI